MNDAAYWKRIAEETHAKLLDAREALARTNSDKHAHYARVREALFRACVEAERFIADDTCRHDSEKASVLVQLRLAMDGGGK